MLLEDAVKESEKARRDGCTRRKDQVKKVIKKPMPETPEGKVTEKSAPNEPQAAAAVTRSGNHAPECSQSCRLPTNDPLKSGAHNEVNTQRK